MIQNMSSIVLEAGTGDQVVLSASGFHIDPLRVLFMTEADFRLAMRSGAVTDSHAMPILSSESPTVTLNIPFAGSWRIVYQNSDADSLTARVIHRSE